MNDEEIIREVLIESSFKEIDDGLLFTLNQVQNCMQKAKESQMKKIIKLIENKFKWNGITSPKKWKQIKQQLAEQSEEKA